MVLSDRVEIIDAVQGEVDDYVDSEPLELSVSSRHLCALGVAVLLVAVMFASGGGQPEQSATAVPSTIGTGELSRPKQSRRFVPDETTRDVTAVTTASGNQGWPDLPEDRDPSYVGRPGSDEPVRSFLAGKTLLYVNDFGRPTVIDLTTGNQREVLIADGRNLDTFELEFGQIVTSEPGRSDLPLSIGRSIGVIGVRAGSDVETENESAIVLCIDTSGCRTSPPSNTVLANSLDSATQLDSSRGGAEAIADLIGASDWSAEHRWTLFPLDADDPERVLRIPTPLPSATIWLVSQSR